MRWTVTLRRLHEPSDAVPFMRELSAHLSFTGREAMEEQAQLPPSRRRGERRPGDALTPVEKSSTSTRGQQQRLPGEERIDDQLNTSKLSQSSSRISTVRLCGASIAWRRANMAQTCWRVGESVGRGTVWHD
jgi:hypothetical protein